MKKLTLKEVETICNALTNHHTPGRDEIMCLAFEMRDRLRAEQMPLLDTYVDRECDIFDEHRGQIQ